MIIASIVIPKVVINPQRACASVTVVTFSVSETDFEDGFFLSSKRASKHGRRLFEGFKEALF